MSTLDRERLESVIGQALERAEHAREAIAEQIGAVPLGARRATDEDIAALVEQQVAQHPPALITYEDGSQAVISPYIAALAYVDGGRESSTDTCAPVASRGHLMRRPAMPDPLGGDDGGGGGRQWYMDTINGVPVIFNGVTGEILPLGEQFPGAPAAPSRGPQPHTYIEPRTGDMVGIDPFSGAEIFRRPGADYAQLSPQQARAQALQDMAAERNWQRQRDATAFRFRAGESAADRAFRMGESAADRAFSARESELARAQRASEFAATHGLNERSFALQFQQAASQEARQVARDRLDAARQYAELLDQVDPAAFDQFAQLGGGVLSNAIDTGADALSARAVTPAAASLSAYQRLAGYGQGGGFGGGFRFSGGPGVVGGDRYRGDIPWGGADFDAAGPAGQEAIRNTWLSNANSLANDQGLTLDEFYAQGSPGAQFNSPESSATRINWTDFVQQQQEPVIQSRAMPAIAAANGFNGVIDEPTLMLVGEAGPEQVNVDPMTRQNMDNIFAFRRRQGDLGLGPALSEFDPRFSTALSPYQQAQFAMRRQLRYGIPAQATLHEADRFRLGGIGRGQVAIGG